MSKVEELYEQAINAIGNEEFSYMQPSYLYYKLNLYLKNSIALFTQLPQIDELPPFDYTEIEVDGSLPNITLSSTYDKISIETEAEFYVEGKDFQISVQSGNTIITRTPTLDDSVKVYGFNFGDIQLTNRELLPLEKIMIVEGMVLEWLKPRRFRAENLSTVYSDKEYSASPRDKSFIKIYESTKEDYRINKINYSYIVGDDFD